MHLCCGGLRADFYFHAYNFLDTMTEDPEELPALPNVAYVPDEVASEVAIRAEAAMTEVAVAEVTECLDSNTVQQGRLHCKK